MLDASVSDDGLPAGATVTTEWSKTSGDGTVVFGDPGSVDTVATFAEPGVYVLRLTANDTELTASDDVRVTVEPDQDTEAPSVPTALLATDVAMRSVGLAWQASTDNRGVAGYRVYRNSALVGFSTVLTYSDTGLEPSTSYSYQVAAYDAAGNESDKCAALAVTTEQESQHTRPRPGGLETQRIR